MNIGYACLAIAVPGSEMKSCTLNHASEARLRSLIEQNLMSLAKLIDYNARNGIYLFRISSDLIPFGSSVAAGIPWDLLYEKQIAAIGDAVRRSGMRVSMHPGQYTVLNSPAPSVVQRAIMDLRYHVRVLDSLKVDSAHKIILHVGGVYEDKKQAIARFIAQCRELEPTVRTRLVLENDDKLFTIQDVLDAATAADLPVVYDNLHNAANPADPNVSDADWIRRCAATWKKADGPQKIHYSQQHPGKKRGAHAESICIDPFLAFCRELPDTDIDVMLEVKDKNISALKCINCTADRGIGALEEEWQRYEYSILERSPERHDVIGGLLRKQGTYPAVSMYREIEGLMDQPVVPANAVTAAEHAWKRLESMTVAREKRHFHTLLVAFSSGAASLRAVKNYLVSLAQKYDDASLLQGYYLYR